MLIIKGYKFRLDISREVASALKQWSGLNRRLYNAALTQRKMAYDLCQKSVTCYQQDAELKDIKQLLPEFKLPPAQSLQQTLQHLETAFERFFTGTSGFPKYKRRKDGIKVHLPQFKTQTIQRISKHKGQVELPKLGLIRFWWSKKIPRKVKSCSLSFQGNHWYISFLAEQNAPRPKPEISSIGLDVGCNTSVASSKVLTANQKLHHNLPVEELKQVETAIAHRQRVLALKKKGSRAWHKNLKHIRQSNYQLTCIRKDWIHKFSSMITDSQGFIFVEDLDIQSMTENTSGTLDAPGTNVAQKTGLNRSIHRQSWGFLFTYLDYKSKWKGRTFRKVPAFNTSLKCRNCKYISVKNRERGSTTFKCQRCKFVDDADVNAAFNVEEAGLALIASEKVQQLALKNHPAKT